MMLMEMEISDNENFLAVFWRENHITCQVYDVTGPEWDSPHLNINIFRILELYISIFD